MKKQIIMALCCVLLVAFEIQTAHAFLGEDAKIKSFVAASLQRTLRAGRCTLVIVSVDKIDIIKKKKGKHKGEDVIGIVGKFYGVFYAPEDNTWGYGYTFSKGLKKKGYAYFNITIKPKNDFYEYVGGASDPMFSDDPWIKEREIEFSKAYKNAMN